MVMGFDPMMQIIHEDDVVAALIHAVDNDLPGVYNVAAEDPTRFVRLVDCPSPAGVQTGRPESSIVTYESRECSPGDNGNTGGFDPERIPR